MQGMLRNWWLVWRITKLNFRVRLEYRAEFLMMIAVGLAWQGSVVIFATVILTNFPGMGGWSSTDVLLMASMRLVSHALYMMLLGPIILVTREGYLDAYMLRPISVYRQVQFAVLNSNGFGDVVVGICLFGVAMRISTVDWSPVRLGYLAVALAGGTLMEGAIKTVIASAAMHAPAASYWGHWADELMTTFGNYPLHILPTLARDTLIFVLPLGFIAYLPAAVLTGRLDTLPVPAPLAVVSPLIGLLAFVAARRIWDFSLRHYKGFGGT